MLAYGSLAAANDSGRSAAWPAGNKAAAIVQVQERFEPLGLPRRQPND